MNRATEIVNFIAGLDRTEISLPPGIRLLNPYQSDPQVREITARFYHKFYNDDQRRVLILGINPGRFGAGTTGISFTDPKRLVSAVGLPYTGKITHEPSSVFIYDMISAYGGVNRFYQDFYINSLFPLTVVKDAGTGRITNYNYYDDRDLFQRLKPFIVENIKRQCAIAGYAKACICLGTGRNADILRRLNDQYHFFDKIFPIEHPRFIVQYKNRERQLYIDKYVRLLDDTRLR